MLKLLVSVVFLLQGKGTVYELTLFRGPHYQGNEHQPAEEPAALQ